MIQKEIPQKNKGLKLASKLKGVHEEEKKREWQDGKREQRGVGDSAQLDSVQAWACHVMSQRVDWGFLDEQWEN